MSYTSENMLTEPKIHEPKCENYEIATIRTSSDSHLHWKGLFPTNLFYFRIIAVFAADKQNDNSSKGNKTTNIYKQNPVLNGYHIISELDDILKSVYYESPLGYDNVDWYVYEVLKLEKKGFLL